MINLFDGIPKVRKEVKAVSRSDLREFYNLVAPMVAGSNAMPLGLGKIGK